MRVGGTPLDGLVLIEPRIYRDDRGFFFESYNRRRYVEFGIGEEFVQDNCSQSKKGVIRGLHFQDMSAPMVKLVRCSVGEACSSTSHTIERVAKALFLRRLMVG